MFLVIGLGCCTITFIVTLKFLDVFDIPAEYHGLSFAFMFVVSLLVVAVAFDDTQIPTEGNYFKTVAHVDLSNRQDLKLISVDNVNDVAMYEYVNPSYAIQQGDTVSLVGGATATVVSFDAVGFTVSCEFINPGMSGTAVVTEDGTQIGYISKRLDDGNYRCIWS